MSIIAITAPVKFSETIIKAYNYLTGRGHTVLTPVLGVGLEDKHEELMKLHRAKIDLCETVVVLNVGGYMGHGTYEEIGYAVTKGKKIEYLESLEGGVFTLLHGYQEIMSGRLND